MLASICATVDRVATRLSDGEAGQGLTEYTLILTLIAIVAILALTFFGGNVTTELSVVARSI